MSRSTSSSPAAGPNAIPTATARFSSTTGDCGGLDEPVVQGNDPGPVRLLHRWRPGVAGRDLGLQRVRTERALQRLRASQRGETASDEQLVPAGAVLVREEDGLAGRTEACASARGVNLHQRYEAVDLGLAGDELGEDASQPQRVLAKLRPDPVVALRGE